MLEETIHNTLNSFDFAFCIVVDIITYLIVKMANEYNYCSTKWSKRIVLLCVIVTIGIIYGLFGVDNKLIFNSAILAPVFWSWIMKPICKYYNIDYGCKDK